MLILPQIRGISSRVVGWAVVHPDFLENVLYLAIWADFIIYGQCKKI